MKERVKNLILAASSVVVFLLILELVLALFWPQKIVRHTYQAENGQYHPVIGWVNKPGISGRVIVSDKMVFNRTHNSRGLRSLREIPYEKPAGTKRVLILGDSFTWGMGVNDGDIISEQLQRRAGEKFEVINGSVIGYGTDQELLWLTEEGLKYKPDLVVLAFYPWNDYEEISQSISYGYPKPFFGLEGDELVLGGVPVPDTTETRRKGFNEPQTAFGKLKKFLRHHTHTYPFFARLLNSIPGIRRLFVRIGLAEEYTRALPGIPYKRINPDKVRELSDALIREIQRVSTGEAKAEFLFMLIPIVEQDPGRTIGYEGDIDWDERYAENTRNSAWYEAFTKKYGMRYLDLLPATRSSHLQGIRVYNPDKDDHHWSAAGHRMAADALYDRITKDMLQ